MATQINGEKDLSILMAMYLLGFGTYHGFEEIWNSVRDGRDEVANYRSKRKTPHDIAADQKNKYHTDEE